MLTFIHLSDLHLVPTGQELHGLRPGECLARCVSHIAREHGDAEFCVVSGDLTHNGDPLAYAEAERLFACLPMPVHLMLGNHDDRSTFRGAFPSHPCDQSGFIQQVIDTSVGRLILLDTLEDGRAEGRLCQQRLEWLGEKLDDCSDPVLLFLHHPPVSVGFDRMDHIRLQNADELAFVLERSNATIRHLFFGHLHRNIAGSWRTGPSPGFVAQAIRSPWISRQKATHPLASKRQVTPSFG